MKMPKMILFDYGQTLIAEQEFDGVKGTAAVLQYATKNKYNLSAEQVQEKASAINKELGRFDPQKRHLVQIEVPNTMFTPYLYESQGIEVPLSNEEIDTIFWDAAAPGKPTEGMKEFLEYLKNNGIRTGVISNIAYAAAVVTARIKRLLPENAFQFIITSSNYMFRKPNKRIFDLALEKAELAPEDVWYIGAIDVPYTEDNSILTVKSWNELKQRMEIQD
ncbi:MAG: HAD family hydrolase [Acetatifactor sp.]|nr:HAD family hydrolase [Acetatifactor sp.]